MDDFSDIINLPHHESGKRRHMTVQERAAQFSAFAALSGFGDQISETARLTAPWRELSEDDLAALNAALQALLEAEPEHPTVTVRYFQPDEKKSGGAFVTYCGQFRHYDAEEDMLRFADGTAIPVQCICKIE